jgi:hypothetical protein
LTPKIDDCFNFSEQGAGAPEGSGKEKRGRNKNKRKRKQKKRKRSSSEASNSSSGSDARRNRNKNKKRHQKKRGNRRSSNSGSGSSSEASRTDSGLDSEDSCGGLNEAQLIKGRIVWKLLAKAWPIDQRPAELRRRSVVYLMSLDELLRLKKEIAGEDEKKNLGEEVFSKDGKPEKFTFKKQTDDGVKRLHPARGLRQPLAHPKHWYKMVPKKRDSIIRNFPMDHLGITGKVSDVAIGKMHNRSVKITLDLFCKTTHREARGPHKAGKYSDGHQLRQGINHYCLLLHVLWPQDYTGLVIQEVLNEAQWAELVSPDDKKRAEIITEFFNSVMTDNAAKAVHDMYPLVYEQVLNLNIKKKRKKKTLQFAHCT